jgi:hypothetical protein
MYTMYLLTLLTYPCIVLVQSSRTWNTQCATRRYAWQLRRLFVRFKKYANVGHYCVYNTQFGVI